MVWYEILAVSAGLWLAASILLALAVGRVVST
jgi:hypothetical protein